jgi:hypothetical protein
MSESDQTSAASADLLIGAAAILDELRELGIIERTDSENENKNLDRVYYIAKAKKLPIGRFGKSLIASRAKLRRAVHNLVP